MMASPVLGFIKSPVKTKRVSKWEIDSTILFLVATGMGKLAITDLRQHITSILRLGQLLILE